MDNLPAEKQVFLENRTQQRHRQSQVGKVTNSRSMILLRGPSLRSFVGLSASFLASYLSYNNLMATNTQSHGFLHKEDLPLLLPLHPI